jgi:hypothetical protein
MAWQRKLGSQREEAKALATAERKEHWLATQKELCSVYPMGSDLVILKAPEKPSALVTLTENAMASVSLWGVRSDLLMVS